LLLNETVCRHCAARSGLDLDPAGDRRGPKLNSRSGQLTASIIPVVIVTTTVAVVSRDGPYLQTRFFLFNPVRRTPGIVLTLVGLVPWQSAPGTGRYFGITKPEIAVMPITRVSLSDNGLGSQEALTRTWRFRSILGRWR
jgi:hypothetical protein